MRGAVEVEEPGGEVLIRGNMRQQAEIGALRASSVRQPSAALGRHCRSIDAELLASETLEGCMEGIRPSTPRHPDTASDADERPALALDGRGAAKDYWRTGLRSTQ